MKNIYIIDEHRSSMINGIGTFLRTLADCLGKIHMNICMIILNSDKKEFSISYVDEIKYIYFPQILSVELMEYPKIISIFLRLHIKDNPENIFCLNHTPCTPFLKILHASHPLSKIVFIIHNQLWTGTFQGDANRFQKFASGRGYDKIKCKQALFFLKTEQEMYNLIDAIVCLSKSTYQLLTDTYQLQKEKLWLIPNGLNQKKRISIHQKQSLRKQLFIDEHEKVILFVGRISKSKGVYELIKAFEHTLLDHRNIRLVIAGTNVNSSEYPTSDRITKITYTGQLNYQTLTKWYQIADIGIIPSYFEQCSYVGIEMMMHELPIIASDGLGVSDMFEDGYNAIIAPIGRRNHPKDFIYNLSKAMNKLLMSDEQSYELRKKSYQRYKTHYTISKMRKSYQKLFDSLSS